MLRELPRLVSTEVNAVRKLVLMRWRSLWGRLRAVWVVLPPPQPGGEAHILALSQVGSTKRRHTSRMAVVVCQTPRGDNLKNVNKAEVVDKHCWRHVLRGFPAAPVLAAAGLFTVSSGAGAQATEIQVLQAQYTTVLSTTVPVPSCDFSQPGCDTIKTQQATVSNAPLERELQVAELIYAKAAADTFSVSTSATAFIACRYCGPHAHATAETSLSFRVLQDTTVHLTFAGVFSSAPYLYDFFSLFDQTTGENLFSHSFTALAAPVAFNGWLDATHIYEMNLRSDSDANQDGWNQSLSVSGFRIATPVPEPSAWAMMVVGLAIVGTIVRRRRTGV